MLGMVEQNIIALPAAFIFWDNKKYFVNKIIVTLDLCFFQWAQMNRKEKLKGIKG